LDAAATSESKRKRKEAASSWQRRERLRREEIAASAVILAFSCAQGEQAKMPGGLPGYIVGRDIDGSHIETRWGAQS